MAQIKCKECGKEVSKSAKRCPNCGCKIRRIPTWLIVLGVLFFLSFILGGGAVTGVDSIEDQVANDAVKEYEIAARQGDPINKCVYAEMVAAAYLQAQDEHNYNKWMKIKNSDCAAAGL